MSPVCFSSSSASIVTNYPDGFTDINAEAAVLGSLILDNDKEYIGPVRAILRDEFYFSLPEHRHIYNAILSLHNSGSGIDCLLLVSELEKKQRLKAVGGVDYVVRVAESTPTKANAIFYADKVLEKYRQRLAWDYIQKQQAILRSGGNWSTIEKDLQLAAQDHADCLPVEEEPLGLLNCGDIQTSEISWLWPNRIPQGMFSLLVGDPGIGKSFLTCCMASTISTGKSWPDGTESPAGSVFLFCDEDDFGKVVVPRLTSNGADITKVYCLNELLGADTLFQIADTEHLRKLEKAIEYIGDVRLILFDPITSYLAGVNANSNSEVRGALGGLVRLAQRHNVCILGISHLNKKADLDAMYRSLGSMGFVAQARSVWGVVKDKSDDSGETKIFSPIKSNLSIKVRGLSYQIEDARLVWGSEPVEDTIDQSLRESPSMDTAVDFLQEILSEGKQIESNCIYEQAKDRGITVTSIRKAQRNLKIKPVFISGPNGGGHWFWQLPKECKE
jgi:hypothetical protein